MPVGQTFLSAWGTKADKNVRPTDFGIGPMIDLNPEQLESIRHLLVDPLRETVKTEIQLSHDRLAAAVDKLADRLAGHIDRNEKRASAMEREIGRLRAFRHRIAVVYGAVMVVLTLVWAVVRDKVMAKWNGR
jgi:hypothetical protein